MDKKWYVVHTYSGYEQKVKEMLEENIKITKMEEYFGDIIVPSEIIMEKVKGQVRVHPPMRAGEVGVPVHVLREHGSPVDMGRQQLVPELISIEALGEAWHVPRRMVLDVDLPPWPRGPGGNAGVNPELPGDAACLHGSACLLRDGLA